MTLHTEKSFSLKTANVLLTLQRSVNPSTITKSDNRDLTWSVFEASLFHMRSSFRLNYRIKEMIQNILFNSTNHAFHRSYAEEKDLSDQCNNVYHIH
jgi:hypothetical protein